MTKEQRTSIARSVSDMMKADNIVEESEIRDMKRTNLNLQVVQISVGNVTTGLKKRNDYLLSRCIFEGVWLLCD